MSDLFDRLKDFEKLGAPRNLLETIVTLEPTMTELLSTKNTLLNTDLYWIEENLVYELTDRGLQLLNEQLGNYAVGNCIKSHHIEDSTNVKYSSFCSNSTSVSDSCEVHSSSLVKNSQEVYSCYGVFSSRNIENSSFISNSAKIYFSRAIEDCFDVYNSFLLRGCKQVKNCYISENLFNQKNKIFCNTNADSNSIDANRFAICNRPVTQRTFERLQSLITLYIEDRIEYHKRAGKDVRTFGTLMPDIFIGEKDFAVMTLNNLPFEDRLIPLDLLYSLTLNRFFYELGEVM